MTYDRAAILGLVLLCAGPGFAQEQGFDPSTSEVDRELDESLREEYDVPPASGAAPPPAKPAPPPATPSMKDRIQLTLGGYGAHWISALDDVELSYREGTQGGDQLVLGRDLPEFDDTINVQAYRMWFELGRHIGFEGGFRRGVFREIGAATSTINFGRNTYAAGTPIETSVEVFSADFDLVVKPVNIDVFELGIHFGARYMFWSTELSQYNSSDPSRTETSTLEAALPMFGLGIKIRPTDNFELYVRGRIGVLRYDRAESYEYDDDDGSWERIPAKRRENTAAEVEGGVMFQFSVIGVVLGYRLDSYDIEREVDERSEEVNGLVHGPFAGLVLEF